MTTRPPRKTRRPQKASVAPDSHARSNMTAVLGALTIAVATFIAYMPSLHGGMLWDDPAYITGPALRSIDGLRRIWFSPGATLQYYPVLYSAFWLEWQLWQANMFAYHLVKVAEHVLAAWLLWGVLRQLRIPGAWFAAVLFALHPVNVESVAWISEQKNTLSAMFGFGAVWCYLRFDDRRAAASPVGADAVDDRPRSSSTAGWYAIALILFVLAVLSKSVVATLPAALLVIAWWKRGRIDLRGDVVPLLPWFAVAVAAAAVTAWFEQVVVGAQGGVFELGILHRLLLAPRIVWFYALKLVWPARLIFFYPRWAIDATDWTWWLSIVALVATLLVLVWLAVARGRRAPLAAWLVFLATLVPVLGFLNVYPFRFSYVADHFQYLAQVSLLVLAASGLATLAQRSRRARRFVMVGGAAIVTTLGWLTWKQSDQYGHDAVHHYRAILERNPSAWIAYENWGSELMRQRNYDAAIPLLRQALDGQPDYFEAIRDLAASLEGIGRLSEAIPYYERATHLDPDPKGSANAYGTALLRAGRAGDAIPHLERAIALAEAERNPIFTFYLDLGRAYVAAGRVEDGVTQFRRARERAGPAYPLPGFDALLGDGLVRLGRDAEALPYLRRAVDADPADAIHRLDLGRILYNAERYDEAQRYLQAAIDLRPDLVDAYIGLAFAQNSLEQHAEARQTAARAVGMARRVLSADEAEGVAQSLAPLLK